ncbi:MAG: AAA family ATPase [Spirulinaceae cyanobacterium]
MTTLADYRIIAQIYESNFSVVYRAIRNRDSKPIILKFLKQDYPSTQEIAKYKQEYEITRNLRSEGVILTYGLQKYQNTLVMILEDFGGQSLNFLFKKQLISLEEFLQIALKIVDILAEIHDAGVIHKDLNLSNIVYNPETKQVKIIDFGISTVFTQENPPLKNPQILEGTLAYISPEQTGRMNRAIDYRTDFYSVGVSFYELLTQQLPFTATDAMELVHCHLAKQPLSPQQHKPNIPTVVSNLVMKLMAKRAEDRYQSTWSLKKDLSQCLTQYRETGKIELFSLGEQDISEQFLLPQKLYGREAEVTSLLQSFEDVTSNKSERNTNTKKIKLVLVSGASGIGKSAFVKELYKPITQRRGYFIAGEFAEFQSNMPYTAIASAFSSLVKQLLTEEQNKLNQWRNKILAAVGNNAQVIIEVIPELELIIGKQPTLQKLGLIESQNRFNLVFPSFMQVFCQLEHPLVLFLDNLQWVDSASLNLVELVLADPKTEYLFLIGAYRNNEVDSHHPLTESWERITQRGISVQQINLAPLKLNQVTQFIGDTLHQNCQEVKLLAELVWQKTRGNPFFINQFLQTLYQRKQIYFCPLASGKGKWQWNLPEIEAIAITENVVDLMAAKLQKLPQTTCEILKIAACIGNNFALDILSLLQQENHNDIFTSLLPAIQEGLIVPNSDIPLETDWFGSSLLVATYKFLHDKIRCSALALMEREQRIKLHWKIGIILLQKYQLQADKEDIFLVVDHLNLGKETVTDSAKLLQLARLNLIASKKARDTTAYRAARQYLITIKNSLGDRVWQDYALAFSLYKDLAELESIHGNFEATEVLLEELIQRANSNFDLAEIYRMAIVHYTVISQEEKAIALGIKALALLDIKLPENQDAPTAIQQGLAKNEEIISNREIATLVNEPEGTKLDKNLAIKILNALLPPAYLTKQEDLFFLIATKIVTLSLEYGFIPESSYGVVCYGMLWMFRENNYQQGYKFGLLARNLSHRFGKLDDVCKTCYTLANNLIPWVKPLKESEAIFEEGYRAGLNVGEYNFVSYILIYKLLNSFYRAQNLEKLQEEIAEALQFVHKIGQKLAIDTITALETIVLNLTGKTDNKYTFTKKGFIEKDYLKKCQQQANCYSLCHYHLLKAKLLYLYGKADLALQEIICAGDINSILPGKFQITEHNFYHSLCLTALYLKASPQKQNQYWQQLEKNQTEMQVWADNCPENFLAKHLLVAAEIARIKHNQVEAINLYNQAIEAAESSDFLQIEAIGHELAAQFWARQNNQRYAFSHWRDAHYKYQLWGAKYKVEDLEKEHPELLTYQLGTGQSPEINKSHTSTVNTSSSSSLVLDFVTVVKASQAISGEIVFDKLLANLMKIATENAGAREGYLLLQREDKMLVEAVASVDNQALVYDTVPIDACHSLPWTIINYVTRTQFDVLLNDAAREGDFINDPYIAYKQLKSVLCTPILNRGKLLGILYLENNLIKGAFTEERLEILRILSAQAAISIENALLYASVENKVAARTKELNNKNFDLAHTLQQLKHTQSQLVQSEKMSSLGQMIAGIAHEINNPVSFIYGNIEYAREYIQDLLDLINTYQEEHPQPSPKIQEVRETIDLDFLVQDLQKLLKSMKVGAERIRNIVISLKNFSRLDRLKKSPVNLHEGLDNTILILQHRLRGKGEKPSIKLIKNYGKLPLITCYGSQLNQVFMNLLANAIDALEGKGSEQNIPIKDPEITIYTELTASTTIIRIIDNGTGISAELQSKIFDPFFTTKSVGSGTGLGLSISYQIVVEKHGGSLACHSFLGQGTEFIIEIPLANS